MKSVIEILAAVYDPAVWRVIDEWGDYCIFCGASDGRDQFERGVIHHYADCLLRQVRAHLMAQVCVGRRMSEAAADVVVAQEYLTEVAMVLAEWPAPKSLPEYPDYGSGGDPRPDPLPSDRHPVPAELDVAPEPKLATFEERVDELEARLEDLEQFEDQRNERIDRPGVKDVPTAAESGGPPPGASSKADPELTAAAKVVPEAEVYRTARAEPETIPEVKPELLHSWQATGNRGAVYCVNCNLVSLAGVPTGILAGGVCPGTNPAPAEVKSVAPAVPLVEVMCPRCGARETVPATGGAFPDLPQITMEGPFTVASWTHPAFGRQTGVYCRKCWFDVVASLVAAILPPAVICHPAQTGGPGKLA
jgi:hypothetical protein